MAAQHFSGGGDPNGVVFGSPGDTYQNLTPGTETFWTKATGFGTNTGWAVLSGSSSVAASNVLTFRPGSGETGPVVFDDFNALYAQFDALRSAAQNSGKFKIVFDDQNVGGPGNPVILDSGPGGTVYDFQYATLVGVHEDANVLLEVTDGGGEGDSLTIVNALWFEGLTITATGTNTPFVAAANQTFTLTRTAFLGGGGQFVMDFLGVAGCILHLNDESTIERNGVFPAGQAAIRINTTLVTVHMNGANCRVNGNAFVTGGGGQLTPIVNSSSARFDFDQADVGGVVNAQMSTATGYWTYGPAFPVTDPNGVLSATESTLIVDEATGIIWRNTDGATAWVQFGGGSSATQYAFVFQPGGTPSANVFDDWATLVGAMSAVDGPKLLQFDDQFLSIVIPSGTWDMTDTVWEGIDKNFDSSSGSTLVLFDDGAVVEKLRTVRGLRLDVAVSPAILDLDDGDVFTLDDYSVIGGFNFPIIDLSNVEEFKTVTISVRHGSQVLQQSFPITGLVNGGLIIDVDKASLVEANTVDNGVGLSGFLTIRQQAADSFAALQSFYGGTLQIINSLGGFNLQPESISQLNAGIVNYFTLGGAVNANLMPASWHPGGIFVVKNASGSGTVTINPSGADTIDGNPTHVLTAGQSVIMVSDGVSNYMIIGEKS